jgi:NADPH2:quinone reductase
VEAAPGGEFVAGTQVADLMGGMGRDFDGGYAEYTVVPAASIVPFRSSLQWPVLGAVPEMLQTAHGSLTIGVNARPCDTLLIRGGTSSIGLACIVLAKQQGITVIATSRNPGRAEHLRSVGADHVVIDTGIGTDTLPDTLRATAVHGTVSFSGMLADVWTIPDFYPMAVIPNGVRLTAYSGEASDLPAPVLQSFLDAVTAGTASVPIAKVYRFEDIVQAHIDMENSTRSGKLVVTTR